MNPIKIIFELRDIAHYRHLYTESYAEHVALNGFYDELLELGDCFIESYQGVNGRITGPIMISLPDPKDINMQELLGSYKISVIKLAESLEGEAGLINVLDDICTLIDKTQYLLTLK